MCRLWFQLNKCKVWPTFRGAMPITRLANLQCMISRSDHLCFCFVHWTIFVQTDKKKKAKLAGNKRRRLFSRQKFKMARKDHKRTKFLYVIFKTTHGFFHVNGAMLRKLTNFQDVPSIVLVCRGLMESLCKLFLSCQSFSELPKL